MPENSVGESRSSSSRSARLNSRVRLRNSCTEATVTTRVHSPPMAAQPRLHGNGVVHDRIAPCLDLVGVEVPVAVRIEPLEKMLACR